MTSNDYTVIIDLQINNFLDGAVHEQALKHRYADADTTFMSNDTYCRQAAELYSCLLRNEAFRNSQTEDYLRKLEAERDHRARGAPPSDISVKQQNGIITIPRPDEYKKHLPVGLRPFPPQAGERLESAMDAGQFSTYFETFSRNFCADVLIALTEEGYAGLDWEKTGDLVAESCLASWHADGAHILHVAQEMAHKGYTLPLIKANQALIAAGRQAEVEASGRC